MKPELAQLVARWQRDLRLLDWRLVVDYVRDLTAPDGSPVYGLCMPHVDAKRARIHIRDPETPFASDDPSVEETLIHELLHLHFAPLSGATSAEIAAEEQAVWAITEAIARKGAGREAQMIARAMKARAQSVSEVRRRERYSRMDFAMFLAALRAALTAEDPKAAIESLIAEVEKAAGGGEPPPPAEMDPADDPNKGKQPPAAARAAAPAPAKVETHRDAVSRAEFERFRVDTLLDRSGGHLNEAQMRFARGLSYDKAREYVATVPASDSAPAAAVRASSPTTGARQQAPDPVMSLVDRRMGVESAPTQAVVIDPLTKKLSVSALAPIRVQAAGGK